MVCNLSLYKKTRKSNCLQNAMTKAVILSYLKTLSVCLAGV